MPVVSRMKTSIVITRTKKDRITSAAKELLVQNNEGLRFSELVSRLHAAFPDDPHGTITGTVWNLDTRFPDEIYKPSRGLFRLLRFREGTPPAPVAAVSQKTAPSIRESDFYEPFADYLVNELEECTVAVPAGGNRFGGKWGTPDVFGIFKARESDIVKTPREVVVAEIKLDAGQLITAFGQVCGHKLFSHRSYLVVPRQAPPKDIHRLDALCLIFGIGLILYDTTKPNDPSFQIRVRAAKHEPDSFYVNQNIRIIANDLMRPANHGIWTPPSSRKKTSRYEVLSLTGQRRTFLRWHSCAQAAA